MGVLGDLKGPVLGVALSALAFVVVSLVGLFDVLSVLTGADPSLLGLVAAAIPYLIVLVLLGFVGLASVAWGFYRVATSGLDVDSRWLKNDRVAGMAEMLERQNEWARRLNVSEKVRPSQQERAERELDRLKDDYAAGRLTESEFERKLERLMERTGLDERAVDSERPTRRRERDREL